MGATPIAGHRNAGEGTTEVWRNDTPADVSRRETASWSLRVHPSLMPTVFAPSGSAPAKGTSEELAERKV